MKQFPKTCCSIRRSLSEATAITTIASISWRTLAATRAVVAAWQTTGAGVSATPGSKRIFHREDEKEASLALLQRPAAVAVSAAAAATPPRPPNPGRVEVQLVSVC